MDTQNQAEVTAERKMLAPPPGTFQDREDLINHVRDYGASQGYVVTIKKSRKDKRVILGCDRGGMYRNRRKIEESKRKRKTCSRLINCPFEAVGKKVDDVWVLTVRNGVHNHEPLRDMSEHPSSRRFSEEEVRQIKLMTEAGLKPSQVLKTLKQSNPELQSTPRHLYNLKAKMRQGKLSDKSYKSWRPNRSIPINNATHSASVKQNNHQVKVCNFIGGKFVDSQGCATIDVRNPATQEVVSQVPLSTYEEFKDAVSEAKRAFLAWKSTPMSTRQHIMFKLYELIRRDAEELALKITTEQGKTLSAARSDVLYGLEVVQHACCIIAVHKGDFVSNASTGIDTFCIREPLGVCAAICPFNFPTMIPLWVFPIAVACGNTFVLKPSEKSPGASMMLAALAMEAGLPDGVLNIVHGSNDIIDYICDDDDIKALSFIGSSAVGIQIYARAAARGKRIQSNIVGKNFAIIMPDASINTTLNALVAGAFCTPGQNCVALSTAIFVGGSTLWEVKLVELAKTLRVNAGTNPSADIGPVISKEEKDRTSRLIQSAVDLGARLLLDGRNILVPGYNNGNFVGPTILHDVISNMECYKDDILGPLLVCVEAESLQDAINMVNRNRSVNGASIFTTSGFAAKKFQNEIETAQIGINVPVPIALPFTSDESRSSYLGDPNYCGKTGVQFFTQIKRVSQQWNDVPNVRRPLDMPSSPEANRRNQRVSSVSPPSPNRDSSRRRATGSASPASVSGDSRSRESFLPMPDLTSPSPTNLDLTNRETSLAMPTRATERDFSTEGDTNLDLTNRETSLAMPTRATERDFSTEGVSLASSQISQWNDSPSQTHQRTGSLPIPPSERIYLPSSSQRVVETSMALPCNGAYLPTSNNDESIAIPTSHQTDQTPNQASERVYILSTLRLNDSMGQSQTFRRTDNTLFPVSERIYMSSGSTSQVTDVPLHLNSFQRNDVMPSSSQQVEVMPPNSERMYVPSIVQRNSGMPSTSERLYLSTVSTSQRMYGQNPLLQMEDFSGQGSSMTLPTSQRI